MESFYKLLIIQRLFDFETDWNYTTVHIFQFGMNKNHIRNFAIIANVDHGKSTLADRMLEVTKTVSKEEMEEQFLDRNPISRERGITIKLAPVRMNYILNSELYILNLIDTPGHVDFSYEVSRTLAACEGVVLLVDVTQGIQAQTVAHYQTAQKLNLKIIPVINKIDLPDAKIEEVAKEIMELTSCTRGEILLVSAKTGQNIEVLLERIVMHVPAPQGKNDVLRALIFDAVYDEYRGVVAYVRIIDGNVKKGERIQLFQNHAKTDITELGFFSPFLYPSERLIAGEIGYIITGIKDIRQCRVGDTIINSEFKIQNSEHAINEKKQKVYVLPGYIVPKPMVFLGVYPRSTSNLVHLKESLVKLALNDTALSFTEEYSAYLGSGYRVGFLGLLHAEIVKERLKQEFNLDLLFTMPHVLYEQTGDGRLREPIIKLTVYTPITYVGNIMTICQKKKGILLSLNYHESYAVLEYKLSYSMFMRGLSAELKSVSSGFASIDYELIDYEEADLARLEIRINDYPIDVLSEYVYKDEAIYKAREKAAHLKNSIPKQQFRQIIHGVVDAAIVVREEIPPFRKDVLQKMSGGDRTRKDKLLEKQKKGKSRMLQTAKIELPQEALYSLLENK